MLISSSRYKMVGSVAIATLLCAIEMPPQMRAVAQPLIVSAKADQQLKLCEQTLQAKDVDAAIQACLQAQSLYQKLEEPTPLRHRQGEINATIILGQAYENARQTEAAITTFTKGLNLAQQLGQYQPKIVAMGSLVSLYESIGKTVEAQQYRSKLALSLPKYQQAEQKLKLGQTEFTTRRYDQAIQVWTNTLALFRDIDDRNNELELLRNMGLAQGLLGNTEEAIALNQRSANIAQEIGDRQGEAWALGNLGLSYLSNDDPKSAIASLEQASLLLKTIQDRQGMMVNSNNVGRAYVAIQRDEDATVAFQTSLEIARSLQHPTGEIKALKNLGALYLRTQNYAKSIEHYQQVLSQLNPNEALRGEVLLALATAHFALEDAPKGLHFAQEFLQTPQASKNLASKFLALRMTAIAHESLNDQVTATQFHHQALKVARAQKNREFEAKTLSSIGANHAFVGQYSQAIQAFQEALQIQRLHNDISGQIQSLNDLGVAFHSLGSYPQSSHYLEQSLTLATSLQRPELTVLPLTSLGNLLISIGDFDQATQYHRQALARYQKLESRAGEAGALNNLGIAYQSARKFAPATEAYEKSLAISRTLNKPLIEAKVLGSLGSLNNAQANFKDAVKFHQASFDLYQELGDSQGMMASINNMGSAHYLMESYSPALNAYQRALEIAQSTEQQRSQGEALNNIGATLAKLSRHGEAERSLYQAIQIWEDLRQGNQDTSQVSLLEQQTRSYKTLQDILITQGKREQALEISERGRAQAFLNLLRSRGTRDLDLPSGPPPTLEQIKQVAKTQNATLVEYSILSATAPTSDASPNASLAIWVIPPTGSISFHSIDLNTQLQNQAPQLLRLLASHGNRSASLQNSDRASISLVSSSKKSEAQTRLLRQLHDILIAPIINELPTEPTERIIFIPEGPLLLTPFAALLDAQNMPLIQRHTILTAPSIQVLEQTHQLQSRAGTQKGALIIGNPTMPKVPVPGQNNLRSLPSLPGAEREARSIARQLKTKALLGSDATKANVLTQISNREVIHLATHGLLDEERGLGSAIALAPDPSQPNIDDSGNINGLLTAEEILDLELQADLAVLSACDTGRGRITGDGVIGLSRSFIAAGVPSVVVSLWAVLDAPTADLMTEFYRNLNERKLDKAQALRQAMLTTMKTHPNPKDWAAFTLIGDARSD